jgi:hypothetical protein
MYLRFPIPHPEWDPVPPWLRLTDDQLRRLFDLKIRMDAERAKIFREADQQFEQLNQQKIKVTQQILGGG